MVLITLLSSHIFYHFIQIFYRSDDLNPRPKGKLPFILFFLLSADSVIFFIQYAFIRNSLMTGQSPDSFTSLQCAIGFFGAMGAGIVASILVYFILLHRIRLVFDDSMHKLSDSTYWTLNISFAVTLMIGIYPIFINYQSTEFQLEFYDSSRPNVAYCAVAGPHSNSPYHDDGKQLMDVIAHCIYIGGLGTFSLILLYLFTSRLYALQSVLIRQHLSDQERSRAVPRELPSFPISPSLECRGFETSSTTQMVHHIHLSSPLTPPPPMMTMPSMPSISENRVSVDISPSDSLRECADLELDLEVMSHSAHSMDHSMNHSVNHSVNLSVNQSVNESLGDDPNQYTIQRVDTMDFQSTKQMSMTIEEVDGMKEHDQSAQTIMDYHSLTKKHSILVMTMVLSAIIWLILLVAVNPDQFFQESVIVAIIWIVGIWLGFGASKWYWQCLTRYFLCALCYRNRKRDISARMCYIFYC